MPSVIEECVVPAGTGRGFRVAKGNLIRITTVEGPQLADLALLAADDVHEGFHAGQSLVLNMMRETGSMKNIQFLYSRPPYERIMGTIVEDTVGVHCVWLGSRCSNGVIGLRSPVSEQGVPRTAVSSCQSNLETALAPFEVPAHAIPDVLNLFMANDDDETVREGRMAFRPSPAKAGDCVTIRAELDLLVGVSACPGYNSPGNHGVAKPLLVEVLGAG